MYFRIALCCVPVLLASCAAPPSVDGAASSEQLERILASGHRSEDHRARDVAIDLIESAGFRLVARSEINANPKDEKNYEKGVWTLAPTFAAGGEQRYAPIGESDRFTLKFVKVEK